MAEAREGISGEAAAESSPVIGELQRGGVCQHRRAGQCVLPGEREGDRGEGCGREPGGCEAEDKCVIERGAGVMKPISQDLDKLLLIYSDMTPDERQNGSFITLLQRLILNAAKSEDQD
jgi:hypothetical protein